MPRVTEVVKHLLIINVIIYFGAQLLLGAGESRILSLYYPESDFFRPFQFVTHMFMHADLNHLLFNMLTLFFLGPFVEMALGAKRFLTLYFVAGFGAMLLHLVVWNLELGALDPAQFQYLMERGVDARVVGASGAIYGVLIAFAAMFPDVKLMLLIPPIPIKAKYLALGLIAFDLFSGISRMQTGVAHFAHLGGALFGFLLILYWRKVRLR
ncbi:MAG: rhomboid family intramembrane serine protease [Saprospiraceae bacterium]|nr:rhomboid family intramembrane serine protease [Saprospiraceae bacterium]